MTTITKTKTNNINELKPRISVVGIGGAGGNAVTNMILSQLEGVNFLVMNTDAQALRQAKTDRQIQLGFAITQGLGAGSKPDVGRAAAEESIEEIVEALKGNNMVFIAAGMGGGTGTGAAPVIARAVREQGMLTVGVVTKPFNFEGAHRARTAEKGIQDLQQHVDTLIVIPNQNLFRVANENTTFSDAFRMADDVLYAGVRGVTDLMINPGLINLDFADIRSVMSEMGKAMMGTGEADGDSRAVAAAEAAIANPLLDDVSMRGARGVIISITGGEDMTLYEVDEAANRIREEVDPEANIIFGSTYDEKLSGRIRVSVVATGIDLSSASSQPLYANAQSYSTKPSQEMDSDILEIKGSEMILELPTSDNEEDEFLGSNDIDDKGEMDRTRSPRFIDEQVDDRAQTGIQFEGKADSLHPLAPASGPAPNAGFFQRLWNRVGKQSSEQDVSYTQVLPRAVDAPKTPQIKDNSSIESNDELDIPAFIRRQGK